MSACNVNMNLNKPRKDCRVEVSIVSGSLLKNCYWFTLTKRNDILCEMIFSLVFDQMLSLRSIEILKTLIKLHFLKKYFICNDCSQLKLARNLPYMSLPIKPMTSAKLRT